MTQPMLQVDRKIGMTDAKCRGTTVLNLGCGHKHLDGAINLDRVASVNPNIVHDLDKFPWPAV
jgi:hypothetical protein